MAAKLQHIKATRPVEQYSGVNLYCMDESRFGLMLVQRRVLTRRGVKPLIPYQHRFANFYLFGAYSPIHGDHFTLELPSCNSESFQLYLNAFSQQAADELKILILDNGAFHHSKALIIPDNIVLVFLPPYCPELNPAEKIWRLLKDHLANTLFKTLDDLSNSLQQIIQHTFKPASIMALTAFKFLTRAFHATF